ncbi:MAG: AAA family ATPase, partial [Clostridia bacterium]|nr:AAA family ATPase [Clostridia bacterium]
MNLTPKQIVNELNEYIIGQDEAKRAVAIALRNRYRRSKLSKELREDITPKNIIMKGPTGVGKTEIARRLAKLVKAPFVKVEATKYTEVGYVGRDVESMIRDLVEVSIRLVKDEKLAEVREKAEPVVQKRIVDALFNQEKNKPVPEGAPQRTREDVEKDYLAGKYSEAYVELDLPQMPKQIEIMPGM